MGNLIGLDFETYSDVNLPKHGLDRYLASKNFKVLLASVAWEQDGAVYTDTLDFVDLGEHTATNMLRERLRHLFIVAHNAMFEWRVLHKLGIEKQAHHMLDSAMIARVAGAASKLEAAAPQLLNGVNKLDTGAHLIKVFSIPGPYQEEAGTKAFVPRIVVDRATEWQNFKSYCEMDARLSLQLAVKYRQFLTSFEPHNAAITMEMSWAGWPVDINVVEEMNRRYLENLQQAEDRFRHWADAKDLNLNSNKQLQEWCAARGVKSKSFDEKNVARIRRALAKKMDGLDPDSPAYTLYSEVDLLMETKQILGGSSLKKLDTILNVTGEDGRLRDQYLHCGAGQTLRTTGRSVQMQNLKRITVPSNMEELFDDGEIWSNEELSSNIRQVFRSSHPVGRLIVGDFASVESRGLAYLAGEHWKLEAFRKGNDLYKELATLIYNVGYIDVTKDQRQVGKVGELSCGYQAGAVAVKDFALNYGVELSEAEAAKLVRDWREANPNIVQFWKNLDLMLHQGLDHTSVSALAIPDDMAISILRIDTPTSLIQETGNPRLQSLEVRITGGAGEVVLRRIFHGCYDRAGSICYYRPAETKNGNLWRPGYTDPKTKQFKLYSIYGGKLAGILTQSFCRELFFQSLRAVNRWAQATPNIQLIGQFHDEIVLDWVPGYHPLAKAESHLQELMSDPGFAESFPLAAEVKSAYRYIK